MKSFCGNKTSNRIENYRQAEKKLFLSRFLQFLPLAIVTLRRTIYPNVYGCHYARRDYIIKWLLYSTSVSPPSFYFLHAHDRFERQNGNYGHSDPFLQFYHSLSVYLFSRNHFCMHNIHRWWSPVDNTFCQIAVITLVWQFMLFFRT